jgi:hypothetical protein
MARKPSPRQRIADLLAKFEPSIRAAFDEAIQDITSRAEIARIAESLERGDVDGALRALHIDPAAFRVLDDAIRQTYIGGGANAVGMLPILREPSGSRVVVRFDARNPRAESWLTDHSSRSITRIVDDQRDAARRALTEGMARGDNPRQTALNIVGRINAASGRREGGIIGLTSPQERFVANARAELTSGDPKLLRAFLERTRRDKRFDRTILNAIRDGKPLDAQTVNRIVGRYSDLLLQLRGETVARTESMASLHASQEEAFRQAIETGAVNRQDVRRVWVATKDKRTRDSHAALDGESVGLDQAFSNGLRYPGDPNGPPEEVISCRCTLLMRVDFLANLR